ncbi:hypothetical protein HDU98_009563 [Podochytrium sp. JEL0797]|nr:hypothetical protein HDU98_009563 [Podochytrium sp. JEL0797]
MQSDKMDMSLDTIARREAPQRVYADDKPSGVRRQGGRGGFQGEGYNNHNHGGSYKQQGGRRAPYERADTSSPWRHDKYEGRDADLRSKIGHRNASNPIAQRLGKPLNPLAKPFVSRASLPEGFTAAVKNLDPKASAADVQAAFAEFGTVLKATVSYDAKTQVGSAEIVFKDHASLKSAIATYNGVVADGRTLSVEEIVIEQQPSRGLQIAGRGTASLPVAAASIAGAAIAVPVLKTSVGSVVVGGMYSDRETAPAPRQPQMQYESQPRQQQERKIPITERLGGRVR